MAVNDDLSDDAIVLRHMESIIMRHADKTSHKLNDPCPPRICCVRKPCPICDQPKKSSKGASMKKQSTRKGASIERSLVLRKITQLQKRFEISSLCVEAHEVFVQALRDYLRGRVVRFKKKAGGL